MTYPPAGSFCWSPLGHLTIIHNPRLDVIKNIPENNFVEKKKIFNKNDLENYFKSLRRNYQCDDEYCTEAREFFLNDSAEVKF